MGIQQYHIYITKRGDSVTICIPTTPLWLDTIIYKQLYITVIIVQLLEYT